MFLRDENARSILTLIENSQLDEAQKRINDQPEDQKDMGPDSLFLQALLYDPVKQKTRRIAQYKKALQPCTESERPQLHVITHLELAILYNIYGQALLQNLHFTKALEIFAAHPQNIEENFAADILARWQMMLDLGLNNATTESQFRENSDRAAILLPVYEKLTCADQGAKNELLATCLLTRVYYLRATLRSCDNQSDKITVSRTILDHHSRAIQLLENAQKTRPTITDEMLTKERKDFKTLQNKVDSLALIEVRSRSQNPHPVVNTTPYITTLDLQISRP